MNRPTRIITAERADTLGPDTPWHLAGVDPSALRSTPSGPRVDGPPLGSVLDAVRDAYLLAMGRVAAGMDSPGWWESTAAEKQVTESAIPRGLALTVRARQVLAADDRTVVIAPDAMTAALIDGRGEDAYRAAPRPRTAAVARARALFAASHTRRLASSGAEVFRARVRRAAAAPDAVVLFTWLDGRSFAADGTYTDPYFGALPRELAATGRAHLIVPTVLPGVDERWAMRAMEASAAPLVPPHALLRTGDVMAACVAPPIGRLDVAEQVEGVSLSALLAADAALDAANRSVWFDRLLGMVPERLAEAGVRPARLILPFENISWEKLVIANARATWPGIRVAGYQHSSITARKTSYFMSGIERAIAPLPDRIVTSGRAAHDLLAPVYGDRVVAGGGLRYEALARTEPLPAPADGSVLVALSLDADEVSETLRTLAAAFAGGSLRVRLKLHPTGTATGALEAAGLGALPAPLEFTDAPLAGELPGAAVMVATSSTAVLEALAAAVPVVVLELARSIVTGPLTGVPDAAPVAYGPDELAARVEDVIAAGQALRDERRATWTGVVGRFISPAGPETLASLLEG